ncbi:MAG TPA: hypothetical protein VIO11_03065, partial [Candidatus Methanoperedens sp.]
YNGRLLVLHLDTPEMVDALGADTVSDYIELSIEKVAGGLLIKPFVEIGALREKILKPLTESLN